jgi:isoleucyl-tRNA synthetase
LLMGQFERFVEDLSNWFLRRSRRRFWKSESDSDKLAAFTTLYEVLEGLCRVIAPILPFLAEEIYQNIVARVQPEAPFSVHLCDYPEYDPSRVDEELASSIDVIVKFKNAGLGLRNQQGLKVRQPLASMTVVPASAAERLALGDERLRFQLLEELNVKQLELRDSTEGLLEVEVLPDFKSLGPKYGRLMKGIQAALREADVFAIETGLAGDGYRLEVDGVPVTLTADDVEIRHSAAEGLAFAMHDGAFVGIDTVITPELRLEGLARDFVRGVQNIRKELDLNVADRIHLRYLASDELGAAVSTWEHYIRRETLALTVTADDALTEAGAEAFKVAGNRVLVKIEVAEQE